MKQYETIVVGLGAMGSAAVYQLAKRGQTVLGIDRYTPPHTVGSTHGDTRLSRLAIGEGAAYTPLAKRSYEIWREIEQTTGDSLLTITGGLIISNPDQHGSLHGKNNFLKQTIKSAEQFGIPHEVLTSGDIRRRFPQFKIGDGDRAYFERDSGFLRPEQCVRTQLALAKAAGAEIRCDEKVVDFNTVSTGVRIVTEDGEYAADSLILAAGPWLPPLIGPDYSRLFRVYRQVLYWFAVEDSRLFAPGRFPVFIKEIEGGGGGGIYGFPAVDGQDGGIKIATEQFESEADPECVDRTVSEAETTEMFARNVVPFLNGVVNRCVRTETCLYTVTPDSGFVIDRYPGVPQILVASPCSGHGFKHSAAIGEILAELTIEGKSTIDSASFGFERLLKEPSARAE